MYLLILHAVQGACTAVEEGKAVVDIDVESVDPDVYVEPDKNVANTAMPEV